MRLLLHELLVENVATAIHRNSRGFMRRGEAHRTLVSACGIC